jgi:hypothetical protein
MKGATKRIHVPGRAAPPHLCVASRPREAGAAHWHQPQGTPASHCTLISRVPPSAMGPRDVPARCTNLRGNRRRWAGAMRTHRPCAVCLCNSVAWVRTGAWRSCRLPPSPWAKPPSLRPYRTWPQGPAPPPAGRPATPPSEAAVSSQSSSPTAMSSLSEVT